MYPLLSPLDGGTIARKECSMYHSLIQSAETIGSHTLSPFRNIFAQHHWAYFEPGILGSILRKIQIRLRHFS